MKDEDKQGKSLAVLSYCTVIGALIAMSINNDDKKAFASFHIRQALGLSFASLLLGFVVGWFDNIGITAGFWGFFFVVWLYGFIGALQGRYHLIPILGIFFQKFFKRL